MTWCYLKVAHSGNYFQNMPDLSPITCCLAPRAQKGPSRLLWALISLFLPHFHIFFLINLCFCWKITSALDLVLSGVEIKEHCLSVCLTMLHQSPDLCGLVLLRERSHVWGGGCYSWLQPSHCVSRGEPCGSLSLKHSTKAHRLPQRPVSWTIFSDIWSGVVALHKT